MLRVQTRFFRSIAYLTIKECEEKQQINIVYNELVYNNV